MKIDSELGEWFNISIGTKQGNPAPSLQFIAHLERVMGVIRNNGMGVTIQGERFADDINLIEDSWEALQESVRLQ